MTSGHTVDGFRKELLRVSMGARTIEEYCRVVSKVLVEESPLDYIQSIDSPGSRLMPIAACMRWAEYIEDADLYSELKKYRRELKNRIPPTRERYPFSEQEMARMSSKIDSAGKSLAERFSLRVLLQTGARSSDICSGITRDVLYEASRHGWSSQIRTKGKQLRTINFSPFEEDVRRLLAIHEWDHMYELLAPTDEMHECTNKRGYRVLDARFKALCEMCRVSRPHITHRCRHTIASAVYDKTRDLMATRNWFGWSSTATAERYSHGKKFEEVDASIRDILPRVGSDGDRPKGKKR